MTKHGNDEQKPDSNGGTGTECDEEQQAVGASIRMRKRVRALTYRNRGRSLAVVMRELTRYLRGGLQYFRLTRARSRLRDLDAWIRRRLSRNPVIHQALPNPWFEKQEWFSLLKSYDSMVCLTGTAVCDERWYGGVRGRGCEAPPTRFAALLILATSRLQNCRMA